MNPHFSSAFPNSYYLKSTKILFSDELVSGCILIESGKIKEISSQSNLGNHPIFDVGNLVVMAGLVDPHVHINEPGRTDWEGFETATKAAAAGGITTLIEMPLNASPVTTTRENFYLKLEAAKGKTWVNCGFWGGLIPDNANNLESLLTSGVFGLKAFLTHSGIDEFPNVGEEDLTRGLVELKKYDLPLLAHCELDGPIEAEKAFSEHPTHYLSYLESRPDDWELKAVELMISLCRKTGAKVHIVHVSSAECLPLIRAAKAEGLPITAETCPHYLVFDAESIPDGDTRYKCAPPIRKRANNEKLWKALLDGTLDFIASDHSPAPPERKEVESGNLKKAWGGIAGLQFSLPLIWTEAKKRNIPLNLVAKWLCESPTKLAGLETSKGKIAVGIDADLVIWNPEAAILIEETGIYHRHKITPYIGMTLKGNVELTLVGGKMAYFNAGFSDLAEGKILLRNSF